VSSGAFGPARAAGDGRDRSPSPTPKGPPSGRQPRTEGGRADKGVLAAPWYLENRLQSVEPSLRHLLVKSGRRMIDLV